MDGRWRVAGASVVGARHSAEGASCQDRHRLRVAAGGALIAVASDGAGSAELGGDGAAIVCETVVQGIEAHLAAAGAGACTRGRLLRLCRAVRAAIADARALADARATEAGLGLEACHATLVGAVVQPGAGGVFFHIGDGAALALDSAGEHWQLSPPRNGEYANTTFFFTEREWRRNLRFAPIAPRYDTIFLMTDGVTDIALTQRPDGLRPHLPFFQPIAKFLSENPRELGESALHATLDSPGVRERTDDDKTLVWARAERAA